MIQFFRGDEPIVPLFDDLYLVLLECQLEHSDDMVVHELSRDGAATKSGKTLFHETYVLCGLHYSDLILPALRLDRNHVVATAFVKADVELVYFDLPDPFDRGAKVVLEAIGREAEESIDQPVVPDNGKQRLFVVEGVGSDQFWRGVRNGDTNEIGPRKDPIDPDKLEPIRCLAGSLYDPFHA